MNMNKMPNVKNMIQFFENLNLTEDNEKYYDDDDDNDDDDDDDDNDEYTDDDEDTYKCPLCDQVYYSTMYLNEHFINSHTTYENLIELDKRETDYGFPGFDLLELIGYVQIPQDGKINKLYNSDSNCPLCQDSYKSNTNSELTDTDIIINDRVNLPVFMSCCNASLCKPCCESFIRSSQLIVCPYCKTEVVNDDKQYIVTYDYECDNSSSDQIKWLDWRTKHLI